MTQVNRNSRSDASRPRTGLTLAELLVVLVVLAALSTVAVRSLKPVQEQARHAATQKALQQLRAAIVGSDSSSTAVPTITGFVADTGRLPLSLQELLVAPPDLPPFAVHPHTLGDYVAQVPRGWRGPYLRAGLAGAVLLDGFGGELQYVPQEDNSIVLSDSRAQFVTQILSDEYQGAMISGSFYSLDANGQRVPPVPPTSGSDDEEGEEEPAEPTAAAWSVSLIGPGSIEQAGAVLDQNVPATADQNSGAVTYSLISNLLVTPQNADKAVALSIGPRLLQARCNGAPIGAPVSIVVRPGATLVIDLLVE